MLKDDDEKVRCPKCGRIYRGIYTDGYIYFHDCPACKYDGLVYNSDLMGCPEDDY